MSDKIIDTPSFDNHCHALGKLCIVWAVLDRKLTDIASVLIGLGPEMTACLFSGSESLNPRSEAIKKLLVRFPPSADADWCERLRDLIKNIQEKMGPRRNRYVHDEWTITPEATSRVQWGGHIHRGQGEEPVLRYARIEEGTTTDLLSFIADVECTTILLTRAVISIGEGRLLGQPPEPFWQ